MTTSYFLRAFYTNAVIAAVFAFVFFSTLSQVYAQPVNPGGNGGGDVYVPPAQTVQNSYEAYTYTPNTPSYQNQNYNYNQPTYTNTSVNTAPSQPIKVNTYEPSFYTRGESVDVTLKGFIDVPDSYVTSQVWFEWGETSALGNKTSSQTVNISFSFQTILKDLKPNTTYYYRAVGQNAEQGIVYGTTVTVRTPSIAVNQTAQAGTGQNSQTNSFLGWPFWGVSNNTQETEKEAATSTSVAVTENTNEENTNTSSVDTGGGLFPKTLLGWGILTILVFIVVGFVLYLVDLYQELKKRQEEERKRRANGNSYANGGVPS
jgi:hypothetical protein